MCLFCVLNYRYTTQDEFVAVAEEFHNRSIPVDIIVIDGLHWAHMGDWSFDPQYWPAPQEMVDTISKLGMQIMVSVWPFSAVGSSSFPTINASNYGVDDGDSGHGIDWNDPLCHATCFLYDPTQQKAREYLWMRVKEVRKWKDEVCVWNFPGLNFSFVKYYKTGQCNTTIIILVWDWENFMYLTNWYLAYA